MTLARRQFLVRSVSLGAALAATGLAGCAAGGPRVTQAAPGVTRVSLGSVTAVVFSHFHGDHIDGLRNKADTTNVAALLRVSARVRAGDQRRGSADSANSSVPS